MRKLPLAYECDRGWDSMSGDSVVRHCDDCERSVVNLSALDEASARELLEARTGTACVRYQQKRGHMVFAKVARILAVAAAASVLLAPLVAHAEEPVPSPAPSAKNPKKKRAHAPRKRDADWVGILTPKF